MFTLLMRLIRGGKHTVTGEKKMRLIAWIGRLFKDSSTLPSFTCPKCGMTSHNPNDVENSYCGNCHAFFIGDKAE
jgi:ribosomal protein S27AE